MSTFSNSFRGFLGGLAIAAGLVAAAPASSSGAVAALKGITSISVKSKDAALNEITLAFDPCCYDSHDVPLSYNIDAFQLSVHYDASKVTLVSSTFAAPFKALSLYTGSASNPAKGVSEIAGIATCPEATTPGAVNMFYETFQLKKGVSLSSLLTFTLGADSNCDFLYAVNSAHPDDACDAIAYIGPNEIQSSSITTSIAPASVPLPPAYAAGGATLLLALGGAGLRYRGKRHAA